MSAQDIDVKILGRPFTVSCTEEEREGLMQAINYLEDRMRSVRDAGNITNVEKVAIMTALYLSHELLNGQSESGLNLGDLRSRMHALEGQIDAAIETQDKLL